MKLIYRLITCILLLSFVTYVHSFELNISTKKSEYPCGEPIVIYVSLQNTENKSVELPKFLGPEYYEVEYYINGKRFIPCILMDAIEPSKYFEPGEIIEEEVMLSFNGKEWLFPKSGDYIITAQMYGQSSNMLTVTTPAVKKIHH